MHSTCVTLLKSIIYLPLNLGRHSNERAFYVHKPDPIGRAAYVRLFTCSSADHHRNNLWLWLLTNNDSRLSNADNTLKTRNPAENNK